MSLLSLRAAYDKHGETQCTTSLCLTLYIDGFMYSFQQFVAYRVNFNYQFANRTYELYITKRLRNSCAGVVASEMCHWRGDS